MVEDDDGRDDDDLNDQEESLLMGRLEGRSCTGYRRHTAKGTENSRRGKRKETKDDISWRVRDSRLGGHWTVLSHRVLGAT